MGRGTRGRRGPSGGPDGGGDRVACRARGADLERHLEDQVAAVAALRTRAADQAAQLHGLRDALATAVRERDQAAGAAAQADAECATLRARFADLEQERHTHLAQLAAGSAASAEAAPALRRDRGLTIFGTETYSKPLPAVSRTSRRHDPTQPQIRLPGVLRAAKIRAISGLGWLNFRSVGGHHQGRVQAALRRGLDRCHRQSYFTDLAHDVIAVLRPDGRLQTLVEDERLKLAGGPEHRGAGVALCRRQSTPLRPAAERRGRRRLAALSHHAGLWPA